MQWNVLNVVIALHVNTGNKFCIIIEIILPIYQSGSIDPEYTDEADSSYLGDLEVDLSDIAGGREREVLVGIIFGGTNMKVEAEIKSTGEKVNAHFNFLRIGV
jgi:hypothetical protein